MACVGCRTGGLVENVTWESIQIVEPRNVPIYINVYTEDAALAQCKPKQFLRNHCLSFHKKTFLNVPNGNINNASTQ